MPQTDAVLDAILSRRSIRKFTDEPVTTEQLTTILEAGRWAPSGKNNQPWKFLVLRQGDERLKALEAHTKYAHMLRGCQAFILLFLDRERTYHQMKDYQGAGACMQNMLLATHTLGLGAVWIGQIVNQAPDVLATLGLDGDKLEFMAGIALGYPGQQGTAERMDLSAFLLEEL